MPDGNGDIFAALYFLLLFMMEQYRFLEIQDACILEEQEGVMAQFRLTGFKPSNEKDEQNGVGHDCAICQLEPIGMGEWIYDLPCKHEFHRWCLVNWLVNMERSSCPLCRDVILPSADEYIPPIINSRPYC